MNIMPWGEFHADATPARRTELDDFFDRFFGRDGGRGLARSTHLPETFQRGFVPAMNVAETEGAFRVSLELPGLDEKDIDVQLVGNRLVVSGERKWEERTEEQTFHRFESQFGSFRRAVALPEGFRADPDRVEASYEKGVLEIVVPKVEPTPASRIKVEAR